MDWGEVRAAAGCGDGVTGGTRGAQDTFVYDSVVITVHSRLYLCVFVFAYVCVCGRRIGFRLGGGHFCLDGKHKA